MVNKTVEAFDIYSPNIQENTKYSDSKKSFILSIKECVG